jgi:hypothetical protein
MRKVTTIVLILSAVIFDACSDSSGPATVKSGYHIEIRNFGRRLSSSQQALFVNAATRLESVIVGPVPPVDATGIDPASCGATGVARLSETINGLVIYVSIDSIDGPENIVAQAGPCFIRTSNNERDFRTSIGIIKIDSADINILAGSGNLQQVITHEMMHVVGFGTFWDPNTLNLLINPGANVSYIGPGGIAGCKAVGGASTCATSVPVEGSQGSEGTINSHWRESTFGNELMTGFLNSGTNPLSAMSVESLEDLQYVVNTAAADPYPDSNTRVTFNLRSGFGPDDAVITGPRATWEQPIPVAVRALPVR